MKHPGRNLPSVAAVIVLLGFASPTPAVPIAYQVSALASGMLGGSSFTNALVTLRLTADTSNVVAASPGVANVGTATVSVAGLGTGTITDAIAAFSTVAAIVPDVGFPLLTYVAISILDHPPSVATNLDLGIVGSSGLLGYDLRSFVGPVTGIGGLLPDPGIVHTTLGNFVVTSDISLTSQATFSASAVPEPSSVLLMLAGVAGLTARLRCSSRRAIPPE
jgi:PEP-CTERM motif